MTVYNDLIFHSLFVLVLILKCFQQCFIIYVFDLLCVNGQTPSDKLVGTLHGSFQHSPSVYECVCEWVNAYSVKAV